MSYKNNLFINYFPLWKNILILIIIGLSIIYFLPNIFISDPTIQILEKHNNINIKFLINIKKKLIKNNILYKNINISDNKNYIVITFKNIKDQIVAKKILTKILRDRYIITINKASNILFWLSILGAYPINLGLDLCGGLYLALDVDIKTIINIRLNNFLNTLLEYAKNNHIKILNIKRVIKNRLIQIIGNYYNNGFIITLLNHNYFNIFKKYLNTNLKKNDYKIIYDIKHNKIIIFFKKNKIQNIRREVISHTISIIRNRINYLGITEASVYKYNNNHIVVEIPNLQNITKIKQFLENNYSINFYLVSSKVSRLSSIKHDYKIYFIKNNENNYIKYFVLKHSFPIINGSNIIQVKSSIDNQNHSPIVFIKLNKIGAHNIKEITSKNIGKQIGIILVNFFYKTIKNEYGKNKNIIIKNEKLINVATIKSILGSQFKITGLNQKEANNLSLIIESGSLQVPIHIIQEEVIGPSIGKNNINKGIISIIVSLIAIIIFIFIYYHFLGIIANISLLINFILIISIMSIIPGFYLTLSGIAGIVLNLAMSIDSNILIFERIREEVRLGNSCNVSIYNGYKKAIITILDSNAITLIIAIILFFLGNSIIKGFVTTLIIGIVTSIFTSIILSKAMINFIYGRKKILKKISIGI